MLWKREVKLTVSKATSGGFETIIFDDQNLHSWRDSFVCSNPIYSLRQDQRMKTIPQNSKNKRRWMCVGNFNDALTAEGKGVRRKEHYKVKAFRELIGEVG